MRLKLGEVKVTLLLDSIITKGVFSALWLFVFSGFETDLFIIFCIS